MSKPFSNTTLKNGIIQSIEDKLDFDDGIINNDPTLLAKFTAKANEGMVSAWRIIIQSDGTWQWDDSNHLDSTGRYNIIYRSIVSGQRDYVFLTDQDNNLILDCQKIFILPSATATNYVEIEPSDAPLDKDSVGIDFSSPNYTGVPTRYDKNGAAIFFDIIPNYTVPAGIRVYISREGIYFSTGDTTKTPGFSGLFHDYPALYASYEWARDKGLSSVSRLERDKMLMENDMKIFYSKREKDIRKVMTGKKINYL